MTFDMQPTLKGDLLYLRPLAVKDYKALYEVAADPLIWEQHPVKDRYKEGVFKQFFDESLRSSGALLAIDTQTSGAIGSSRFHGYDPKANEIEIGWTFLKRSHWGGRFNGEMKRLMLEHAFQFVENVVLLVGPQNYRSQRAVEKIGGVIAGKRADAAGRESIVYKICKSAKPIRIE